MDVVKMKQGMSYSRKEKTIILNVFKYFRNCYPDLCVTEVVRRTSKATGCSEKSIFLFRKEESSAEGFKQPSKTKIRKNINKNSRTVKYDNNVRQAIRNIIYDLKHRHIFPSLSSILKIVESDEELPNFSLMTLRRLLFDMGFSYKRSNPDNKPVLVEIPVDQNPKKIEKPKKVDHKAGNHCIKEETNIEKSVSALESVPNQYPPIPSQVTQIHQQNQLYIPSQNHHQMLPVSLPQHENMNVTPHHLHSLSHSNLKHNFHYLHHGIVYPENAAIRPH